MARRGSTVSAGFERRRRKKRTRARPARILSAFAALRSAARCASAAAAAASSRSTARACASRDGSRQRGASDADGHAKRQPPRLLLEHGGAVERPELAAVGLDTHAAAQRRVRVSLQAAAQR